MELMKKVQETINDGMAGKVPPDCRMRRRVATGRRTRRQPSKIILDT